MREVVQLSSSSKASSCRRSPLRHDVISRSFSLTRVSYTCERGGSSITGGRFEKAAKRDWTACDFNRKMI